MGATVTCNKKVGAFSIENTIYYVLFEETYEKNVYPHTPHWCAVSLGTIDKVMKSIFLHASGCEGGGLQNRNGQIHSENYITAWLHELANPIQFSPERTVRLQFSESIYSLPGSPEMRELILKTLRDHSDEEAAVSLETGQVVYRKLSSPAVLALFKLSISPWRVGIDYVSNSRAYGLEYQPIPSKCSVEIGRYAKLSNCLSEIFELQNGRWSKSQYSYAWASDFVESLWAHELKHPGSYKSLIKAYRNQVNCADIFTGSAIVVFTLGENYLALDNNDKGKADSLFASLGITGSVRIPLEHISEHLTGETSYQFNRLVYKGIIHIETPDLENNLAPAIIAEPILKSEPKSGLLITYGSVEYKLLHPAGPRKGWVVERVSDKAQFRMGFNQLKDALNDLALKIKTATECTVTQVAANAASQKQVALF